MQIFIKRIQPGPIAIIEVAPEERYIVSYSISFATIMITKEAFFNELIKILPSNVYTVATDTTSKPL